ncbi:MAG: universal stress protein [Acidimicrobiales bacterium]
MSERSVIVGVDGSSGSQRALDWAVDKADVFGPVSAVAAYHVEALGDGIGTPALYQDLSALLAEDARDRLATNLEPNHSDLLETSRIVRGHPGPALIRSAEGQALLVVGSRGRSALAETLLGSVGSHCVKHSTVPVAVIPESTPVDKPLDHIVVGVDGSDNATAALRWAIRHLGPNGRITAVHSWQISPYVLDMVPPIPTLNEEARAAVEKAVEQAIAAESATATDPDARASDLRAAIELEIKMGDARNVLPAAAETADLLVVGSRGHRGASYLLLGSVTTSLLHHPVVATVVVPLTD